MNVVVTVSERERLTEVPEQDFAGSELLTGLFVNCMWTSVCARCIRWTPCGSARKMNVHGVCVYLHGDLPIYLGVCVTACS